jgi:hypothetical protein
MIKTNYNEASGFKLPTGSVHAVCAGIYDLGVQKTEYNGQERIGSHTVLYFELNSENDKGERYGIYKWYNSRNFSTEDRFKPGLQKDIERWFNKQFTNETLKAGFDLESLYGKNCLLNIIKKQNGKYKVESVNPVISSMEKIEPIRKLEEVPNFVIEKRKNQVVQDAQDEYSEAENFEDDIPF